MKKKKFSFVLMLFLTIALGGNATGLSPWQCSIGDKPVYDSIDDISFNFDVAIDIVENSTASIYNTDNESIATGNLRVFNYTGANSTTGTAIIAFEEPLLLPKGETYKLVVAKDLIFNKEEPSVSNDELSVEFEVPATLGSAKPSVKDGTTIASAERFSFTFNTEISAIEGAKFILERNGKQVRSYSCTATWDWNLGVATMDFGGAINFEKGVEYSIIMPEGCVSSFYRSDITNAETSVNFIGGSAEPFMPIKYTRCSLIDNSDNGLLGKVNFYYDLRIGLVANPVVSLYNVSDDVMVKDVVPALSEENGEWILSADFENIPVIQGKEYSVIIPEETIVSLNGDVLVNAREVMPINNISGISRTSDSTGNFSINNRTITINQIAGGSDIRLVSLDGRTICRSASDSETFSVSVESSGIFLLQINGKTFKIVII